MKEAMTQLIAIGEIIQDLMIVHMVMNALPTHFENFIQSMTTQTNFHLLKNLQENYFWKNKEMMRLYFSKQGKIEIITTKIRIMIMVIVNK